jgi:hypothetical protein
MSMCTAVAPVTRLNRSAGGRRGRSGCLSCRRCHSPRGRDAGGAAREAPVRSPALPHRCVQLLVTDAVPSVKRPSSVGCHPCRQLERRNAAEEAAAGALCAALAAERRRDQQLVAQLVARQAAMRVGRPERGECAKTSRRCALSLHRGSNLHCQLNSASQPRQPLLCFGDSSSSRTSSRQHEPGLAPSLAAHCFRPTLPNATRLPHTHRRTYTARKPLLHVLRLLRWKTCVRTLTSTRAAVPPSRWARVAAGASRMRRAT